MQDSSSTSVTTSSEASSPRGLLEYVSEDVIYYECTLPKYQFADMIFEEMGRIWDAHPKSKGRTDRDFNVNRGIRGGWLYDQARQEVQAQWVEQGIWQEPWAHYELGPRPEDSWKHEKPLPSGISPDALNSSTEARARPPWLAELRRQRDASRPINMFLYEVTNERERMTNPSTPEILADADADINTQAYERVRRRWEDRHIWNKDWRVLPGMSWRHEKPVPFDSDSNISDMISDEGEGRGRGAGSDDDDDDDDDSGASGYKGWSLAKAAGAQLMADKEAREGKREAAKPAPEKRKRKAMSMKADGGRKRARVVDPKTGSVSGPEDGEESLKRKNAYLAALRKGGA